MGQNHNSSDKLVIIGSIGAPFGVRGWVKINSYTDPKENILEFNDWYLVDNLINFNSNKISKSDLAKLASKILEIKKFNNKFIVLFKNITDCDQASLLTNKQIAVTRDSLPELPDNQYYWEELVNCAVYNTTGQILGIVDHLFSTAANDVMVVKNKLNNQELLIPYSFGDIIIKINLEEQTITVDWDVD